MRSSSARRSWASSAPGSPPDPACPALRSPLRKGKPPGGYMSHEEASLRLEAVHTDGAIREKADEAMKLLEKTGDTRRDFFQKAGMAGGAAIGGGALLAAL